MIHGLHVVEGCTEGIRFGAWKGWSVVALKGQEKAGEEKVWVDLWEVWYHTIPCNTKVWADLKPPLGRVGRSLASLVGAAQASQEANIVGELISAEGESNEIGRWVHGGAGFWGWVGGLLSNIETSQIRACGHKSLQLRIRPGKTGRWDWGTQEGTGGGNQHYWRDMSWLRRSNKMTFFAWEAFS